MMELVLPVLTCSSHPYDFYKLIFTSCHGPCRDQVLHIVPETFQQVQHLQQLCSTLLLDLWKPQLSEDIWAGEDLHIRVPAPLVQEVKDSLDQHMIFYKVLIPDVQKLVDQSMPRERSSHRQVSEGYVYTQYHPMEVIYQWMTQIQKNNSELVTQHYLGKTIENRTMYYLQISQPSDKTKKIIWMDCGIHAREWISPAFCQWFVKEILQNYKSDPKISRFLQNLDLYILPVLNIDGYIYSWEKDRLWRKNRSSHMNGTCYGTDLNRNFNSSWGSIGVSYNCSSEIFCGSGPESEPETRAVAQLIERKKSDILCYLTIHSYGQYILTPYGSTTKPPSNSEELVGQNIHLLHLQRASTGSSIWHNCTCPLAFPSEELGLFRGLAPRLTAAPHIAHTARTGYGLTLAPSPAQLRKLEPSCTDFNICISSVYLKYLLWVYNYSHVYLKICQSSWLLFNTAFLSSKQNLL
ncbi:carboxypeptidase O isoform X1 [Grus americana]|uniref:carboxypeptidase O isoform X1 n=1 Tax=Grus americana TaxID=9117 RepID=UPI00240787D2|nr:carboxypeptidase O isoform X1 [Grus americana]